MTDLLVIGGTGYLGRALVREAAGRRLNVVATHHTTEPLDLGCRWQRLDITRPDEIAQTIDRFAPTTVINAAYLMRGFAMVAVTGSAPPIVAVACADVGARFVNISTDLVFDGETTRPYTEDDVANPVLPYGRVKLEADLAVHDANPSALIVRTSLMYGGVEPGPQEQLVLDAAGGADIRFFVDEIRSPVRVDDLARDTLDLATRTTVVGTWHLAGPDPISRLVFARRLAPRLGVDPDVLKGGRADPALGARPKNCSLDSTLARKVLAALATPTA